MNALPRLIAIAAMLVAPITVSAEPKPWVQRENSGELGILIEYGTVTDAVDRSRMPDPCSEIGLDDVINTVFAAHGLERRGSLEPLFFWIDCTCFRMHGNPGPLTFWVQIEYGTGLHNGNPTYNGKLNHGRSGAATSPDVLSEIKQGVESAVQEYVLANQGAL